MGLQLARGDCDITLAFSYGDAAEQQNEESLVEVPLLDDPLVVLLPAGHPLARRRTVELRQFAHERWIAGCLRCRGHFVAACVEAGFEPDIAFTTDDNLAVQSLVAAGMGVALMPSMVLSFMRHRKVAGRPGRLRVTNGATFPIRFLYGDYTKDDAEGDVRIPKKSSRVVSSRYTRIDWFAFVQTPAGSTDEVGRGHVQGIRQ